MHSNPDHTHTEACDLEQPVHAFTSEPITENVQPQKQLTESQFRQLRGLYFTVRHHKVQPCGHKIDELNEPRHRNCQSCWFLFFESHPQLVEVTDRAFIDQGTKFLDKMRGKAYTKWFGRFMATKLRLKQESDEHEARNKTEILPEEQSLGAGDKQALEPTEPSSGISLSRPMESGQPL